MKDTDISCPVPHCEEKLKEYEEGENSDGLEIAKHWCPVHGSKVIDLKEEAGK